MKPRLIVQQKITAFVNKYKVLQASEDGTTGQLVALAQQKRLAFKEKVLFYSDESRNQVAFSFRAEKVFDVHGNYFVEDPNGKLLGSFKKQFKQSLLVSTWVISDASGRELFTVKETNVLRAVLRRYVGWVPYLGDVLDIIMKFFRYSFTFVDMQSQQEVGVYQKTTLFRDHYSLNMTDEAYAQCSWQVFAAMSVALDALQSR